MTVNPLGLNEQISWFAALLSMVFGSRAQFVMLGVWFSSTVWLTLAELVAW